MTVTLADPSVVAKWDRTFAAGDDKSYPSLEVVRLERWYFGGKPGRLLEYGHGSGVNMIHLLGRGHTVDSIDVSMHAQKLVQCKLAARPDLAPRASFALLGVDDSRLPYENNRFDYVNCISVLSLAGSRDKALAIVREFFRVLKPGGKMIVDVNSKNSDFARGSEHLGGEIYLYRGSSKTDEPVPTWCPEHVETFVALFDGFIVDDIGYAAHKYRGSEIHEFLSCVRKPG